VRFEVLVLDYDGTIADQGRLDPGVRQAIGEVRARGVTVVIATGRILDDLRRLTGDLRFVDAIVAENGAVLAFPGSGRSAVLASQPPAELLDALRAHGVQVDIGTCVIEADARTAPEVLAAIRELELPQVLIFNRGRLMVLPSGVNKATGLREALRTLRLSPHNAIAIGDAENDHDLLEVCEIGTAVAWGSNALKARADEILEGTGPAAVAAYIRDLGRRPRLAPERSGRRHVDLGQDVEGHPVSLAVRGRNVLVVGDPKSGKSWVAGLLCEQLILHRYSLCVVDPEGDYSGLEALPGVMVLSGGADGPTPRDVRTALRYPDVNVVIDLSRMRHARKWNYIRALLSGLADIRRSFGIPHRILLDEAHYFLHEPDVARILDLELAGYTLVTYQPSRLHPDVRAASEAIIATRLTDPREVESLVGTSGNGEAQRTLAGLELGQAALLSATREAGGTIRPFGLSPRLTSHVRHREKYLDVPIPGDRAFVFALGDPPTTYRVSSLRELVAAVGSRSTAELHGYLGRGDFSRWIADVFGDATLASELQTVEDQYRSGRLADAADAIVHAIKARYELSAD
jgi:hydroxymethylpyrimidine pyrophosphatase-like HAD family hydrolase